MNARLTLDTHCCRMVQQYKVSSTRPG